MTLAIEYAVNHAGRYAPSPTGDLHRGSLVAALAAFLQARAHNAPWYMRVDDLDTPRVVPGKARDILYTLEAFGLYWDKPVVYQSRRHDAYDAALCRLRKQGCLFDCGCTRREAHAGAQGLEGSIYPGTCRDGMPSGRAPRSLRMRVDNVPITVRDCVQGQYAQNLATDIGDFVVRRADGITAYQLATVVDDAFQGVKEVVRGADLLPSTPRQVFLGQSLGLARPAYAHVPVLVDEEGRKLGKSNGALALDKRQRSRELTTALALLGQQPPTDLALESVDRIVQWGIANWRLSDVPRRMTTAVNHRC